MSETQSKVRSSPTQAPKLLDHKAVFEMSDQKENGRGAALVEVPQGGGKLAPCTINYLAAGQSADALWRGLFENMGVKLKAMSPSLAEAFNEEDVLVNALSIGRFGAPDLETALAKDFLGDAANRPRKGTGASGLAWSPVQSPSKDRF